MKYFETEQKELHRGEIYYINNNRGQVGSEMMKDRPAIIVSNDANNRHSNEVTVVFLTTQPKKDMPTHVVVRSTGRRSVALCEAPTTIDKMRVNNYIARATPQEMEGVARGLDIALEIISNQKPARGGDDAPEYEELLQEVETLHKKLLKTEGTAEAFREMYNELMEQVLKK